MLRQVGPVSPTKSLTGVKAAAPGGSGTVFTRAEGMEHAARWCEALGRDTAPLGALYAQRFALEDTRVDDHLEDTATDLDMLAEKLGGLAGGENGRYTFTATEYLAGPGCGLIHWDVTIEGASTYRGLPTEGRTLTTIGSTFHQFDEDGRILLESIHGEDNGVFVQLGLPIQRPRYWMEGFDPASLG